MHSKSQLIVGVLSFMLAGCLEETDHSYDAQRGERAKIAEAKASIEAVDTSKLSNELIAALRALEQDLVAYELSKLRLASVDGEPPDICDDDEVGERPACDLALIEPAAGPREYSTGVTTSDTKLRDGPSRQAPILAIIEAGTPVAIMLEDQDYFFVKILGTSTSGYAFGDYIKKEAPEEDPHLQEPSAIAPSLVDRPETPKSILEDSITNFADGVENEGSEFKQPAFQCRSELEMCRRNDFGYMDCELTMLVCLVDVLVPN